MPQDVSGPGPRDLYEAVEHLLLGLGSGEESVRIDALRQRFAETRFVPGMSEESAMWAVTQHLFDDVARATEADARNIEPLARFVDLDDSIQRLLVTGLRGAYMQMAQVARSKARR